ncbi:26793_t:CDS:1, partial [Racocetra persica]
IGPNEFDEYKFKAFQFSKITLVKELMRHSISLIVRRFAFNDKDLN